MNPDGNHSRSVSPRRAAETRRQLAAWVGRRWSGPPVRLVAGADCAYSEDDSLCVAAVAVWDLHVRREVESKSACSEIRFPYIPGLFAFREAPAVLKVLERLENRPQVLIGDGHGIAHPRRFGLGSHVGVLADIPTIGCAKGRLKRTWTEGLEEVASHAGTTVGRT